jgi:hypothetical protein
VSDDLSFLQYRQADWSKKEKEKSLKGGSMYMFWNPIKDMRLAVKAKNESEAKLLVKQTLKSTGDWILESRI